MSQPEINNHPYLDKIQTKTNACSLEVLHGVSPTPLLIGCYQLEENNVNTTTSHDDQQQKQKRNGALKLHTLPLDKTSFGTESQYLTTNYGILDGKWLQSHPLSLPNKTKNNKKSTVCHTALGHTKDDDDTTDDYDNNSLSLLDDEKKYVYATACSSGFIELYALDIKDNHDMKMRHIASSSSSSKNENYNHHHSPTSSSPPLCLSLDWYERSPMMINDDNSNSHYPSRFRGDDVARLISSYSDGTLAIHSVDITNDEKADGNNDTVIRLRRTHQWKAHSLFGGRAQAEVWTCCWNRQNPQMVLSGGDDGTLKGWNLRDLKTPIMTVGDEEFGAGVTAVSWHPTVEHLFAVGSYDEGVRLYDVRMLSSSSSSTRRPMGVVNSCGGGVWRLKWHPRRSDRLLVGAMHGGCRVLSVNGLGGKTTGAAGLEMNDDLTVEIMASFTFHESMAYGADWVSGGNDGIDNIGGIAASCSFYDQQAFIWDMEGKGIKCP